MSILNELSEPGTWENYRDYKLQHSHMTNRELKELTEFVRSGTWREVTDRLAEPGYTFDPPRRMIINKSGTGKKRVVYSYPETESYVLKVIANLLYRYDERLNPSCYSFRSSRTARQAVHTMTVACNRGYSYVFKADISNYFNSIPVEQLVNAMYDFGLYDDDRPLTLFLERLLRDERTYCAEASGERLYFEEHRGAMAGIPVASFFANIYLKEMDDLFTGMDVAYARYSDDVLILTKTEEERENCIRLFNEMIEKKGLTVNPGKVALANPGGTWEFLGFSYYNGIIDLSSVTKQKLKSKIKRKSYALRRWMKRKGKSFEHTAKVMTRIFNAKLYDDTGDNDFTWTKWFFPVLTTDAGLKEIDGYMVEYLRYIYSGRHYKGNYRVTYDELKSLGYKSLVHEYYKYREESRDGSLHR